MNDPVRARESFLCSLYCCERLLQELVTLREQSQASYDMYSDRYSRCQCEALLESIRCKTIALREHFEDKVHVLNSVLAIRVQGSTIPEHRDNGVESHSE